MAFVSKVVALQEQCSCAMSVIRIY